MKDDWIPANQLDNLDFKTGIRIFNSSTQKYLLSYKYNQISDIRISESDKICLFRTETFFTNVCATAIQVFFFV